MLIIQMFIHSCCYQANSQIFNGFVFKKFDGFRMYHPLSLNGYSKIINAVKRQRNLGLASDTVVAKFFRVNNRNIELYLG